MSKAKVIIWLLVLGIMVLIIYQNEDHFLSTRQSLRLNPVVLAEYRTPELPLVGYYLLFFAFGLLVAYGFSLTGRFRRRKTIKRLNASTASQEKEILSLKTELARLKGEPLPGAAAPAESSVTAPVRPT